MRIDTGEVLKHNYRVLAKWLIVRLVIVAVLIAGPLVAVNVFGAGTGWTVIPLVVGVGLMVWTLPRIGCGVRLRQWSSSAADQRTDPLTQPA